MKDAEIVQGQGVNELINWLFKWKTKRNLLKFNQRAKYSKI